MPQSDLTERRHWTNDDKQHHLLALEQEHANLLNALEAANLGLWQWDLQTGELRYDATWMWLLGYQEADANQIPGGWENLIHADDLLPFHDKLNALLSGQQAVLCSVQRLQSREGAWRWMRLQGRIVTHNEGSQLVGIMMRIDSEQASGDEPPNLFFNPVTGLPNRHLFLDRLQGGLHRALRAEQPLALFFIAIEGTQRPTTASRPPISNALLQKIARRLQLQLRRSDTLAHYQQHDFVVLMDPLRNRKDSELLADRLLAALTRPVEIGDTVCQLRCHIGLSLFPDHGQQAGPLLAQARAAMQALRQADDAGYGFASR